MDLKEEIRQTMMKPEIAQLLASPEISPAKIWGTLPVSPLENPGTNWRFFAENVFWLVVDLPPPKNDGVKVSWDDEIPSIWKFIKAMFQTTKQLFQILKWIFQHADMATPREAMGLPIGGQRTTVTWSPIRRRSLGFQHIEHLFFIIFAYSIEV